MNTQVNENAVSDASKAAHDAALKAAADAAKGLYADAAGSISKAADALERARGGIWSGIRKAIGIAVEHGHDRDTFTAAMAAACADAEVPAGSIRSYMPTAGNLLDDIRAEKVSWKDVEKMSIQEARKRYAKPRKARQPQGPAQAKAQEVAEPVEATDARRALLSRLNRAIARLDDSTLETLVELAEAHSEAGQEQREAA